MTAVARTVHQEDTDNRVGRFSYSEEAQYWINPDGRIIMNPVRPSVSPCLPSALTKTMEKEI